jgi:CBS domain-containing membrane protein
MSTTIPSPPSIPPTTTQPIPPNHKKIIFKKKREYFKKWFIMYLEKMTGELGNGPAARPNLLFTVLSVVGAFLFMLFLAALASTGSIYLTPVGSFGATAVLVFATPQAPASQPRCVIGAQIIAALIGTGTRIWIADTFSMIFALPFGVGLTLLVMEHLKMVNPPAGGTVAIAILSSPQVKQLGWAFVVPCIIWGVLSVIVAVLVLNLNPKVRYPKYWIWDNNGGSKNKKKHATPPTPNINIPTQSLNPTTAAATATAAMTTTPPGNYINGGVTDNKLPHDNNNNKAGTIITSPSIQSNVQEQTQMEHLEEIMNNAAEDEFLDTDAPNGAPPPEVAINEDEDDLIEQQQQQQQLAQV